MSEAKTIFSKSLLKQFNSLGAGCFTVSTNTSIYDMKGGTLEKLYSDLGMQCCLPVTVDKLDSASLKDITLQHE